MHCNAPNSDKMFHTSFSSSFITDAVAAGLEKAEIEKPLKMKLTGARKNCGVGGEGPECSREVEEGAGTPRRQGHHTTIVVVEISCLEQEKDGAKHLVLMLVPLRGSGAGGE